MFTCTAVYVKPPQSRSVWEKLDTLSTPFFHYYTDYRAVCFALNHPFYENPIWLYLSDIPDSSNLIALTQPINDWLQGLGNQSLPIRNQGPLLNREWATYIDANQANFTITPCNNLIHPDHPLEKHEQYDLRITRDHIDPKRLFDTTLMTVNGLLHRTNYTGTSVDILEGACSGFHANRYQVGLYQFEKIGNLHCVSIDSHNLFRMSDERPLSDKCVIHFDHSPTLLEGKSVLLSLGGYLHYPGDGVFYRHGDYSFMVDFQKVPWPQRFFEMNRLLKTVCFAPFIRRTSTNQKQVSVESLYSDELIRALFSISQTFLIIVDTPEIVFEKQSVENTELHGVYVTPESPTFPLWGGYGKFYEYWTKHELDRYTLKIDDPFLPHYLFETIDWRKYDSIDDSREPYCVKELIEPVFFKLGKSTD